jgi:hypothetical protein
MYGYFMELSLNLEFFILELLELWILRYISRLSCKLECNATSLLQEAVL